MQNLVVWLSKATGVSVGLYNLLFSSLACIAFLWSLRWLILKLVWRQTENVQIRYQWRRISSYAAFVLTVLLVGRVLFQGFHGAATFLGLLTAGVAIALKDPLVNLVGWLLIIWRRPFAVGDRIQIGVLEDGVLAEHFVSNTTQDSLIGSVYLGKVQNVPDRADFDPFPWHSMAVWILTQMKRWGYVKGNVNYKQIAEQVFLVTDAKKQMAQLEMKSPASSYAKFKVMGREFDPAQPEKYLAGFAIKKAA